MQIVLFRKSRWTVYAVSGFAAVRLGKIEVRFGWSRLGVRWGRPINEWAYDNG